MRLVREKGRQLFYLSYWDVLSEKDDVFPFEINREVSVETPNHDRSHFKCIYSK